MGFPFFTGSKESFWEDLCGVVEFEELPKNGCKSCGGKKKNFSPGNAFPGEIFANFFP
jgi:rubredoxin